jgi:hypothetical protein
MEPIDPQDQFDGSPVNIWPLIAEPQTALLPSDREGLQLAAMQLAEFISPVLADHLLSPVANRLGEPLLDQEDIRQSRLATSFNLAQQRHWAGVLVEEGPEILFLKGFATAHSLYSEPCVRTQGDLDILVRQADLQTIIDLLIGHGFAFRQAPQSPWGMISDASFLPMFSSDGACDIDIHVHPDCYPAYRSLTTDVVFASAQTIDIGDFSMRIPSKEHALLLCVTNIAKDKFDVISLRKVIDAIVLLREASTFDWGAITSLARDGAFYRPTRYFFALLEGLGAPMADVPASLRTCPGGMGKAVFHRVLEDFLTLFPYELSWLAVLWREWAICAEPRVALHNCGLRLRGILRPGRGLPDGVSLKPETLPFANSSNART